MTVSQSLCMYSGDSATCISQTAHQSVKRQVSQGASQSTTTDVVIVMSFSISYAFLQHWWATAARKLPALSPISSHMASKYRLSVKRCFDAATCTRTTTGTDGQLTLTVINPSQHCSWTVIGELLLSSVTHSDESLAEAILNLEKKFYFLLRARFMFPLSVSHRSRLIIR